MANLTPNDYAVFIETRRAAEAGQAKAQYNLGLMYANGVGVEQNYQEALRWYHKSAEKGFSSAQYILAGKYATGQGVDRDIRQALVWYLKASEKGNSRAMFKLGQMFSVPQEELANQCFEQAAEKGVLEAQMVVGARSEASASGDGKANAWYQRAAESGFPAAQYVVGTNFHAGKGVEKDLSQALVWYRKAARQGFAAAQSQLGMMYAQGDGVARDYRQAIAWLSRAAGQDDSEAQYQLALLYEQGLGVAADPLQAETWFMKAAEQGDVRSQLHLAKLMEVDRPLLSLEMYERAAGQGNLEARFALGKIFAEGQIVERDFDKALSLLHEVSQEGLVEAKVALAELLDREVLAMTAAWYRQAAESGDEQAQWILGSRLDSGQGIALDQKESLFWFMLAAEKGLPEAQCAVAEAYMRQPESADNLQEAVAWFRKAAKQGNAKAQSALGALYAKGQGVPKDNRQAASWWLKAAEQGDVDAQFNLGQLLESGGGAAAERRAEQWYLRAIERGDHARSTLALVNLYARNKSPVATIWFEQGAEQGLPFAQFLHGDALQHRSAGVLTEESLRLYLQAAAQGDAAALLRLATLSQQPDGGFAEICIRLASKSAGEPEQKKESGPDRPLSAAEQALDMQKIKTCAEKGDPKAQWLFAQALAQGNGGQSKNPAQALHWYRQSALAGFPAAQASLALMLATGKAGHQDNNGAVYWWSRAAEQGDAESQYNLALMFERGIGVSPDSTLAKHWLQKAAEQGIVIAQTRLGLAYATGKAGEPDLVEAYAWFATAAASGNEAAQANREHAETLMTAPQLKEGKRKAEALAKKLAQRGPSR